MTDNNAYLTQLQTDLAELRADVRQLNTARQNSALQNILASGAEGVADFVQNGAAMLVLVGCGTAMGSGADMLGASGASGAGTGLGLLIGGAAVGLRVMLDLGLTELLENKDKTVPIEPPKPSEEMGLWIFANEHEKILLLAQVPRSIVASMAKKTARRYYMPGGNKLNFSQRDHGKPWGEHLPIVKEKLLSIDYLERAQNNAMQFTPKGAAWLLKMMRET